MTNLRHTSALLLLPVALACSEPKPREEETRIVTNQDGPPQEVEDAASACHGKRVPPNQYEQETAFVPVSAENATQTAKDMAATQLRDRLCQGHRCAAIARMVKSWHTARDAHQVCAMAVIKKSDIDDLIRADQKFAAEMAGVGVKVFKLGKERFGHRPRIAVHRVTDSGVDGGPRAKWLHDQALSSLGEAGVDTMRLPPAWSGLRPPKPIDAVLEGEITSLQGVETMLSVTWRLSYGESLRALPALTFPASIGPDVDPRTFMPRLPSNNKYVSLNMQTKAGGSLCPGDETELWIETSEPLYVRVINLYGAGDGALAVWASDGPMQPGKATSLGKFAAVRVSDVAVERFLVLAAPDVKQLGRFAEVKTPCRLSSDTGKELHEARGIPAQKYANSRSYRLLGQDDCGREAVIDQSALKTIADLPACW